MAESGDMTMTILYLSVESKRNAKDQTSKEEINQS